MTRNLRVSMVFREEQSCVLSSRVKWLPTAINYCSRESGASRLFLQCSNAIMFIYLRTYTHTHIDRQRQRKRELYSNF